MRFSRPQSRTPNDEQTILPLTNIVFLLLIFFLLAGRLAGPDAFSVDPPSSISQTPLATHGATVELSANGQIAVNGRSVSLSDLPAAIKSRPNTNAPVQLKADGHENASRVVAVMRSLHSAGVDKVRLVTAPKTTQ